MFEIDDIVKFREWNNYEFGPDRWKVIEVFKEDIGYGEFMYLYMIENLTNGEVKDEISWVQIEHI